MFDRILVPTDGSPLADAALEVGRKLAERERAKLILVRVVASRAELDEALPATATLEQQAAALRNMGDAASYRMAYGRPAEGIARVAVEEDCRLIVMSHHHRGLVEALRHPSVTSRVLSHAPAPILLWPESMPARACDDLLATPNSSVIVPLDGSDEAERALALAVAVARGYGRPLTLVEVLVPAPFTAAANPYYIEVETRADVEKETREYLAALRTRLSSETGQRVQSMLLAGDPADEILRVASSHEGSVVVMSTHGRTGIKKLLLGSVTRGVMERATTPLLVVPPFEPAKADEPAEEKAERREPQLVTGFTPLF